MPPILTALLTAIVLAVIYLLLAAPLGIRTFRLSRHVKASRERLWSALHPLGEDAGWSGQIVSASPDGADGARLQLGWEGRDGAPIEHGVKFHDVIDGSSYASTVVDDTSLDSSFWRHYVERVDLIDAGDGVTVTLSRTDRYRGLAFLLFRFFALRRELGKLKIWAETGRYRPGGVFEHPLMQLGFAVVSTLILWPFFGLTTTGFALAAVLTAAVGLHELGHMAAFRLAGHRKVRMIFIPLLGGIAIGGRPYDSRFEVAFVALMGAGFSAFLVPIAIAASVSLQASGHADAGLLVALLAGCIAIFNIGNLVPVWKFDGGQVLRQICPTPALLALASFLILAAFLALGRGAGLSDTALIVVGVVAALLSLMTSESGVKPRTELKPIAPGERLAIAAALAAVFAIHAAGVMWAVERFA